MLKASWRLEERIFHSIEKRENPKRLKMALNIANDKTIEQNHKILTLRRIGHPV